MNGFSILMLIFGTCVFLVGLFMYTGHKIDLLTGRAAYQNLKKSEWINTLKNIFPFASKVYYNSIPASMICHLGPIALGIGACFS